MAPGNNLGAFGLRTPTVIEPRLRGPAMRPGRATEATPWVPTSPDGSPAISWQVRRLTEIEVDGILCDTKRGFRGPGESRRHRGSRWCGCRRQLRQSEIPVAVVCADSGSDAPVATLLSGHRLIPDRRLSDTPVQIITQVHDKDSFFTEASDIYRESVFDAVRAVWPVTAAALQSLDGDERLVTTSKCLHNRCRALLGDAVRRAPVDAGPDRVLESVARAHRLHGGLGRGFYDGPASCARTWSVTTWMSYAIVLSGAVAWAAMDSDGSYSSPAASGALWMYTEACANKPIAAGVSRPAELHTASEDCMRNLPVATTAAEAVTNGSVKGPVAACFAAAQAAAGASVLMGVGEAGDRSVAGALRNWTDRAECDADVHHLFPLAYARRFKGIAGRLNALANSSITDRGQNSLAGHRSPRDYWVQWASRAEDRLGAGAVAAHMDHHCLEPGWHEEGYDSFIARRIPAMASLIQTHWLRLRRESAGTDL